MGVKLGLSPCGKRDRRGIEDVWE